MKLNSLTHRDVLLEPLSIGSIYFRAARPSDAEFVLGLRLDRSLNEHLSLTSPDVEKQRSWLLQYVEDEAQFKQFYFVICRLDGVACGTIRLYDFSAESFCWGSWILNKEKTRYAALESALLVYELGFNRLGYLGCHFDVRRANSKVVSFHLRFGAQIVREDEENYYFTLKATDFLQRKPEFLKLVLRQAS
jgi:hypothetical protein